MNPKNDKAASKDPSRVNAMNKESDAPKANNTWELAPLPLGKIFSSDVNGFTKSNVNMMVP